MSRVLSVDRVEYVIYCKLSTWLKIVPQPAQKSKACGDTSRFHQGAKCPN